MQRNINKMKGATPVSSERNETGSFLYYTVSLLPMIF